MTQRTGVRRRLASRLVAANLVVVTISAAVFVATVRLLVPQLFDDRVRGMGGPVAGRGQGSMRSAVVSALNTALVVAVLTGLAIAVVAAMLAARRLARPIAELRATTKAMADGDYRQRVPPPAVAELADLADDVNVLAAALERTEERRRRLVTDLAHELRTPITAIIGYLDAFLDGVMEPDGATLAELADEAKRLERLTADLSLMSRIDEGRLELRATVVDLSTAVDKVVHRLRPQFEASSVAVGASGPSVAVFVDPDRLAQILTNVIGNGLRYNVPGGSVAVAWGVEGAQAWCTVTDTGKGLAAAELETVFERFARGSASDGVPGSGVGLTVARSLARSHGGDLVATSAGIGAGATFILRLPLARPVEPASAEAPS